jgi:hypothetical protein
MRHLASSVIAGAASLAALAMVLAPRAVAGQTVSSPYEFIATRSELTVFAGGATDARGALRLGPGGGPFLGARYSFDVTGTFAIEAGVSYLAGDREVYDPSDQDALPGLLGTTAAHVGMMDGRVRLNLTGPRTWNRLAPYAIGGLGVAFDLSGDSNLDAELSSNARFSFGPSFVGSFGGGVRWNFGEQFVATIEGGLRFWRLSHPVSFQTIGDPLGPVAGDQWAQWIGMTVGATYRF